MTYCVAIKLNAGLVFLSDSRTNAGIDQISTFRKMMIYEVPGMVVTMRDVSTFQLFVYHVGRLSLMLDGDCELLQVSSIVQDNVTLFEILNSKLEYFFSYSPPNF